MTFDIDPLFVYGIILQCTMVRLIEEDTGSEVGAQYDLLLVEGLPGGGERGG